MPPPLSRDGGDGASAAAAGCSCRILHPFSHNTGNLKAHSRAGRRGRPRGRRHHGRPPDAAASRGAGVPVPSRVAAARGARTSRGGAPPAAATVTALACGCRDGGGLGRRLPQSCGAPLPAVCSTGSVGGPAGVPVAYQRQQARRAGPPGLSRRRRPGWRYRHPVSQGRGGGSQQPCRPCPPSPPPPPFRIRRDLTAPAVCASDNLNGSSGCMLLRFPRDPSPSCIGFGTPRACYPPAPHGALTNTRPLTAAATPPSSSVWRCLDVQRRATCLVDDENERGLWRRRDNDGVEGVGGRGRGRGCRDIPHP